jgi:hypothetical protein
MVLAGAAALLCAGVLNAQNSIPADSFHAASVSAADSSSTDYNFTTEGGDVLSPTPAPVPASPFAGAGQYDNKSGKSGSGWRGRLAFEFGGGFNVPTSDTSSYIDTGYQFNVGGGLHLTHGISLLVEYLFVRDGLPSNIAQQAGVDGGNVHVWGLSVDPVIDLMPHHNTGVYVTGGGGFYRKVTNFTVQTPTQFCTYFYCGIGYVPQNVGSFSSNSGGFNIGGGVSHRFAGMYGDGKMAIFAEARYLDVLSPAILNQSANGLGNTTIGADTKLVPISFGLRF